MPLHIQLKPLNHSKIVKWIRQQPADLLTKKTIFWKNTLIGMLINNILIFRARKEYPTIIHENYYVKTLKLVRIFWKHNLEDSLHLYRNWFPNGTFNYYKYKFHISMLWLTFFCILNYNISLIFSQQIRTYPQRISCWLALRDFVGPCVRTYVMG